MQVDDGIICYIVNVCKFYMKIILIDKGWCYLCKFYMNIILGNLTSGKTKSCCNSNGDNTQVTKTVEKNKLHSPSYSKQATARTVRDTEGLRETPEGKECLLNNHLEI